MSAKTLSLTDQQYVKIGRQHASEPMALEASEASARWTRDQARLALYGHGTSVLAAFEALRGEHTRQREGRPEVVAGKSRAVRDREQVVVDARTWVGRVYSAILTLARGDETLAGRLREAFPDDDDELEGNVGTLAALLAEVKARLSADFEADARIAEAAGIQARLAAAAGNVGAAKARRVADTVAIDLLDGKLYVMIRDLNAAARRAIRAGNLVAALSDYRFHHVNKRSGATASDPPAADPDPAGWGPKPSGPDPQLPATDS